MRVDLHIHTTASDSCWTPDQVVAGALAQGIDLIAVSDHDSVESVLVAEDLVKQAGVRFLRSAEVSTSLDGRLFHVLAYGADVTDRVFLEMMAANVHELRRSNQSIVWNLIDAGFAIDWQDYLEYEDDPRRGGFRELNFLIDHGMCRDVWDFFDSVLSGVTYERPTYAPLTDAVAVIREAGGVPVVAHPGGSLRDVGLSEQTLMPLVAAGVAGFECYSQYHDAGMTAACVDFCHRRGMLVTGGSDFHGGFVGRRLGVPVVTTAELVLGELLSMIS